MLCSGIRIRIPIRSCLFSLSLKFVSPLDNCCCDLKSVTCFVQVPEPKGVADIPEPRGWQTFLNLRGVADIPGEFHTRRLTFNDRRQGNTSRGMRGTHKGEGSILTLTSIICDNLPCVALSLTLLRCHELVNSNP